MNILDSMGKLEDTVFYNNLLLLWGAFPNTQLLRSLKCFEQNHVLCNLCNSRKIVLPKFQIKFVTYCTCKISLTILFWLHLVTVSHSFINNFFEKNVFCSQTNSKLIWKFILFTNMCQIWIFIISLIFYVFIKRSCFYKVRTKLQMARWTYYLFTYLFCKHKL